MKTTRRFKSRVSVLAVAACLGLAPTFAGAAGLGRITVLSALGQPLRAEIEVSATRDELTGMTAKVAAPEAFRQAGIEYASALSSIRFVVDKRPNGQAVIRLTSDRPVTDPFVDMLIELNWPAGRLVREYTFLLDPPEMMAKTGPAPTAPVEKVESRAPAEAAVSKAAPAATVAVAPPAARPEPSQVRPVKRGDTLRKIASDVQYEGVSLDQMLVGLFKANRDAFDGGNMNRLKAGKILTVPSREEAGAVSEKDARKEIVAQAADWNAYRRKLAATAAQAPAAADAAGKQETGGKITAKVEAKPATPAETKDQVKVSKTEAAAPATPGKKLGEEEKVAKEKALKEASERVAVLEKNVTDLQKMVELKNQSLAELQKQSAAKPAEAKKVEPAPVTAAKPVEPAKAAPPIAAKEGEAKPAAEVKPAEPVKAEAPKPEAKPEPVAEAKAPAAKPAEAAKPAPKPAAPPPPEPSFLEESGGMLAVGGGAIAALLGGLFFLRRRQQRQAREMPAVAASTLSQASLGANSVFRATGGQSVDTSNVTPATTDFSQAGAGMIDTDEVDPVAEAEVYMAYGRDAQAEEILLEALPKDPKRLPIYLKLLEIYSNRKSVKQFETLATDLYAQTGGVGAEWEKAAAMGLRLDASNPLYTSGGQVPVAKTSFDPDATMIVTAASATSSPMVVPGSMADTALRVEPDAALPATSETFDLGIETVANAQASDAVVDNKVSFDFDLGGELPELPETAIEAAAPAPAPLGDGAVFAAVAAGEEPTPAGSSAMDFSLPDIDLSAAAPVAKAPEVSDELALDFDLGFGGIDDAAAKASTDAAGEVIDIGSADTASVDFDVKLTDSMLEAPRQKPVDLASISLDLADVTAPAEADDLAATEFMAPPIAAETDDARLQEVATKLDLAKAYEEMGDHEGARELLQEVLVEGSSEQRGAAESMLAALG